QTPGRQARQSRSRRPPRGWRREFVSPSRRRGRCAGVAAPGVGARAAAGPPRTSRHRRGLEPSDPLPEATSPCLELGQGPLESLAVEIRPELIAKNQLRVGALPEQVVGDPLLAAGPDEEVWVVHVGCVEVLAELVL